MKFSQAFLDDIRQALPVSTVVGKRVALKRAGRELKGLSPFGKEKTASFFVNDQKQFWHDFSSGKHGDIFGFVMETDGVTFPEAVERLAQDAGIALPKQDPEAEAASARRMSLRELMEEATKFYERMLTTVEGLQARAYLTERGIDPDTRGRFRIGFAPGGTALKDYMKRKGADLEDLEEAGLLSVAEGTTRYFDRFSNRVIFPITDLRGRVIAFGGRAMGDAQPKYLNSPDTPIFHKGENLYNAPAARAAAYAGKPVRVVEGYTDVIAMVQAGHEATVATLGTAVTEQQLATLWKWSAEPIFCLDGDAAGIRAAHKVMDLAMPRLGEGRSANFTWFPSGQDPDEILREAGPEALSGILDTQQPLADAVWARETEGKLLDTPERCNALQGCLREIVGAIADKKVKELYGKHYARALQALFKNQPVEGFRPLIGPASRFGRLSWADQELPATSEYEWWVKSVIPKRETVAVVGATQTGKSFETFNLSMHVAQGIDYRGCRTKQGLVVYVAGEGGKGFRDRLRAYRKYHNLPLEGVALEVLTKRPDLMTSDADVVALIAEIRSIASEWDLPLAFVVIDTYSSVTPGIKENNSEDISRVRQRIQRVERECDCGTVIVDHSNAEGSKVRGHTSKTADIETQLDVSWVTRRDSATRSEIQVKDDDGRDIRRIKVHKQREGVAGKHWDFVLRQVKVRVDADGDDVTSCVVEHPARAEEQDRAESTSSKATAQANRRGFKLNRGETLFFKALLRAIERQGHKPPPGADVPGTVHAVVNYTDLKIAYTQVVPNDEGTTPEAKRRYADRVKTALRRARETMGNYGVIGIAQLPTAEGHTEGEHIIWPTGKRVWGPDLTWPPAPRVVASKDAGPLLAPGETAADVESLFDLDQLGDNEPELPPE